MEEEKAIPRSNRSCSQGLHVFFVRVRRGVGMHNTDLSIKCQTKCREKDEKIG